MKRYLLLVLAICLVLLGCDPTVEPSTGGGKDSVDSTPSIMDADAYKRYLDGTWKGESSRYEYEIKCEYLNVLESTATYIVKEIGSNAYVNPKGPIEYLIGTDGNNLSFGYDWGSPRYDKEVFRFAIIDDNTILVKDMKRGNGAFKLVRTL